MPLDLKANGEVVPRRTHRALRPDEIHNPVEEKKRETFTALIEKQWGKSMEVSKVKDQHDDSSWGEYIDEYEKPVVIPDNEDIVDNQGRLLNQQPAYDRLINAEVQMQLEDDIQAGKVIQRAVDPEGHLIGQYMITQV